MADEIFGDFGFGSGFRREVALMGNRDDLVMQSERIEDLRAAGQKRADSQTSAFVHTRLHGVRIAQRFEGIL